MVVQSAADIVWTAVASQPRRGTFSIWRSRRRDWNRLALRSSERSASGSMSMSVSLSMSLSTLAYCGIFDVVFVLVVVVVVAVVVVVVGVLDERMRLFVFVVGKVIKAETAEVVAQTSKMLQHALVENLIFTFFV